MLSTIDQLADGGNRRRNVWRRKPPEPAGDGRHQGPGIPPVPIPHEGTAIPRLSPGLGEPAGIIENLLSAVAITPSVALHGMD